MTLGYRIARWILAGAPFWRSPVMRRDDSDAATWVKDTMTGYDMDVVGSGGLLGADVGVNVFYEACIMTESGPVDSSRRGFVFELLPMVG